MSTGTEAEKLPPKSVRLIRLIGAAALFTCLLVLAVGSDTVPTERIRNALTDIYQRLSPRVVTDEFPVVVVEIDQASLQRFGPWPWPRTRIADLTDRLFHFGARAVGYDIVFSEPDRFGGANLLRLFPEAPEELKRQLMGLKDPDEVLAKSVGGPNHFTVVGRAGVIHEDEASPGVSSKFPVFAKFDDVTLEGLRSYPAALTNIPGIDFVAIGQGALNWEPDSDGVLRRVPLLVDIAGQRTPSFALELMRVAMISDTFHETGDTVEPEIGLNSKSNALRSVQVKDLEVPVQPDGTMLLHFTGPVKGRTVSAVPILLGIQGQDLVKGKIVIIGFSGVGIEDLVPTPVHPKTPGSDVHAQVIEAFHYGNWLNRPHWAAQIEWGVAILLGVAAVLGLPLLSPGRAVVWSTLTACIVLASCGLAFVYGRLVLDATLPLMGAGIPATLNMAGILLSTERRRRELRVIVAAEETRAEEASKIQLAMLPTAGSLRALPSPVDVWPVLEPAQSVGGDFYDAFMLDERRLYFTVGDVTGKGVSAALFMSVVKALSKSLMLRDSGEFETVIADISREVSRDNPEEMFATALLGIMDVETGRIIMCNAGHENPIVLRRDGTAELWEMEGGPPFCVLDGYPYPAEELVLGAGDALIIVTDGVSEAWSQDGELFGRERMTEALDGLSSQVNSQQLAQAIVNTVRSYEAGREPVDDLTVLAIGYRRGTSTAQ